MARRPAAPERKLLRFFMRRVLSAMRAVFVQFDPVGIVLFVLIRVVIPVLAFGTSQRDFISRSFCSHLFFLPKSKN